LSGILWFGVAALNWLLTLIFIGYVTAPLVHLLAAYSAYKKAEKINRERGGVSAF